MSSLPPATFGVPGAGPINHSTYSTIVRGDSDLVGHVAYALYKRDKLKFCDSFLTKHGRVPRADEVEIFIQTANLDTRIDGYRSQAELLLEAMTEYQLEDAIAQIEEDSRAELVRKLSESKSWGRSIAEALVGSIVVAVVWGALVLILYTNKVGLDRVAKDIFEIDVNGQKAAPSSGQASR